MSDPKEEKAVVAVEQPVIPAYQDRMQVAALGKRIKQMVPGAEKLSDIHAMAWAQYCLLTDTNPFRGESYAWEDDEGKLHIDDGYKVLVRWARRQCPYSETFEPLDGIAAGDIGYRCYILRKDLQDTLRLFVSLGATFDEAYKKVATSAVGVVTHSEMHYPKSGNLKPAPRGWTWDQVARKRALKNTLNLAYGMPSPRELASESWLVGDVKTEPEDWENSHYVRSTEQEVEAAYNAQVRAVEANLPDITAQEAISAVYGEYMPTEPSPFDSEPPPDLVEHEPDPGFEKTPNGSSEPVDIWQMPYKKATAAEVVQLLAKMYAPNGLATDGVKSGFAKSVLGVEKFTQLSQAHMRLALDYLTAVNAAADKDAVKTKGKEIVAKCLSEKRMMTENDWKETANAE